MIKSSPTATGIEKALKVFVEHEKEFTWAGWELYCILDGLTKERFERVISEYQRTKGLME